MFKNILIKLRPYYFVILILLLSTTLGLTYGYNLYNKNTQENKVKDINKFSVPIGISTGQLDYLRFDKEKFIPPRVPKIFFQGGTLALFNPQSSEVSLFKDGKFKSSLKIAPENGYSIFGIDGLSQGFLILEVKNDFSKFFGDNENPDFIKWFFVTESGKQELKADINNGIPNYLYFGNFKIIENKYIFLQQNNKYLEIDLQNNFLKSAQVNVSNSYNLKEANFTLNNSQINWTQTEINNGESRFMFKNNLLASCDFLLQINPNLTCLNKDKGSKIPNLDDFSYTITSINSDGNIQFNYDNVVDIYKTSTATYILSLDEKSSNWLINIE